MSVSRVRCCCGVCLSFKQALRPRPRPRTRRRGRAVHSGAGSGALRSLAVRANAVQEDEH